MLQERVEYNLILPRQLKLPDWRENFLKKQKFEGRLQERKKNRRKINLKFKTMKMKIAVFVLINFATLSVDFETKLVK